MLKFTIITICYNEKEKLRKTLDSVCSQTYKNIEYLIIDGASTDGTTDLFQYYSGYSYIHFYSEIDYGIYNAMNRGIARASGDYVYFMNAGDLFYDDQVLSEVASYIGEDKDTIYFGKICMLFADGLRQIQDISNNKKTLSETLISGEMPCHQSVFSPREALINHYFREKYRIRADYEWMLYSLVRGYAYKAIPLIIGYYDTSGASGRLKNSVLFQKEEQEILDEYKENFTEEEYKFYHRRLANASQIASKYVFLFQLMNYWMTQKQNNVNIGEYLQYKGYRHIAIYGMSHMGLNLVRELKDWDIQVDYAIDKNKDNLFTDIKTFLPEEVLYDVDAIIVTVLDHFVEIKELLKEKVMCPILSLEDLLYEMQ